MRCLEQWLEYFLKFLPTTPAFKASVMKTECYKRLKERFQCKTSEVYLSFMYFVAQDFEAFLRRFQFEQPMIHLLYLSMVGMIWSIMTKFIKKKYLVLEDEDILSVDPLKSEVSSTDFILVPNILGQDSSYKSITLILQNGKEATFRNFQVNQYFLMFC